MYMVGVDIGTTHCKAGVFTATGEALAHASRPTLTRRTKTGRAFYDPDELWGTVVATIREATASLDHPARIVCLGLTSMAESGVLIDRVSGAPRSEVLPWFDRASGPQVAELAREAEPLERFQRTGLRPSFKFGLAKLLWLRTNDPDAHHGAVWLSMADYIAYRLTGSMATDYSLAARTYAFRIDTRTWDEEWIKDWGFDRSLFPTALPGGQVMGRVQNEASAATGLPRGASVAVCGHDHLCAAVAVGAHQPGLVLDSMGTAESLLGTLQATVLGPAEFESGLSFGRHVVDGHYFWLGGLAASGGSVEWIRRQLGEPPLGYEQIQALLAQTMDTPTGILYFPYLAGAGTPWTDATARAAFVGLRDSHTRADLVKAVLEGTAYEMEAIRRAGERVSGLPVERIRAVGGGTRLQPWMRIKADVSGCRYESAALEEAAVLGAALIAAVGCAIYADMDEAMSVVSVEWTGIEPDIQRHQFYRQMYEQGYLPLQTPLRRYYNHTA